MIENGARATPTNRALNDFKRTFDDGQSFWIRIFAEFRFILIFYILLRGVLIYEELYIKYYLYLIFFLHTCFSKNNVL